MMGIPAASAFWTISKEARPLTRRACRPNGSIPSSNDRPITLSTALWRPISSRAIFNSPFTSKMPAAWIPPVRAKSLCASRSFLGSESNVSMWIRAFTDLIAEKFCRMASMLVLPQIPQLLEIVPKRCTEFSFTFTPGARLTITTLSRVSEIPAISRDSRTIASETRNPAASSSSCPGVRMVVAKVFRPIRISSGSSIVRSSCEYSSDPSFFRRMIFPGPMLCASFICNDFRYCCRRWKSVTCTFRRGTILSGITVASRTHTL